MKIYLCPTEGGRGQALRQPGPATTVVTSAQGAHRRHTVGAI